MEFAALSGTDDGPETNEGGTSPAVNEAVELPAPTPGTRRKAARRPGLAHRDRGTPAREEADRPLRPPGTGRTFLAQEIAQFLADETGGEQRLVQFHPSYSYEDFFEGFRPQRRATAGTVAFELEPGPLKLLVEKANADPSAHTC